jgi:hypothetical protein
MKTFAKIYEINSEQNKNKIGTGTGTEKKLVVDVPGFNDMFFPYGRPNDGHLNENGYTITNPEFLLQHTNESWDGQIVFGNARIHNDYTQNKLKLEFTIQELLTLEEYQNT